MDPAETVHLEAAIGEMAADETRTHLAVPLVDGVRVGDDGHRAAAAAQVSGHGAVMTRQLQNVQPGGPSEKPVVKQGDQTDAASAGQVQAEKKAEQERRAELDKLERASFQQAAQQIRDLISHDPNLADVAHQISVDITREGLRIQILDDDGLPMFATGSAVPNDRAKQILQKVVPVLMKLPEPLSITGHTDAAPFHGNGERSNWELSADRANATRRLFADAGLPESRIQTVNGRADRDPLLPADPLAAANRRIAIVVLRDAASKPKS